MSAHAYPWRKVMGRRYILRLGYLHRTRVEALECGHFKRMPDSIPNAKRRHCDECAQESAALQRLTRVTAEAAKRPMSDTPRPGTSARLFLPHGGHTDVRVYTKANRLVAKSWGTRLEYDWTKLDKRIKWEYL